LPSREIHPARRLRRLVLAVAALVAAGTTGAFADEAVSASVAEGRRLLAENHCDGACHSAKSGGDDPTELYRRAGRKVQSREELHRQVAFCVSRLGSMIFPEEIGSVVDALDHDHYHFD